MKLYAQTKTYESDEGTAQVTIALDDPDQPLRMSLGSHGSVEYPIYCTVEEAQEMIEALDAAVKDAEAVIKEAS